MERKKGSFGSIVLIITIVILFIIAIGVVLVMVVEKPNGNNTIHQSNYTMKTYIKALDSKTKEQVVSNYRLEYNNTIISNGDLSSDALTEIITPKENLDLVCWSDNYYLGVTHKTFTSSELLSNVSTIDCAINKIGNIKVEHIGEIIDGESIIKLNISTNDNLENLKICSSWTAGIFLHYQKKKISYVIAVFG